jgi:hypothetical protein
MGWLVGAVYGCASFGHRHLEKVRIIRDDSRKCKYSGQSCDVMRLAGDVGRGAKWFVRMLIWVKPWCKVGENRCTSMGSHL